MEKIKILHIIPSFGIGGAEKVVLDYLTYFDKELVDIRAVSLYTNKDTHYDKVIEDKGLKVYYFDKKPGFDVSMIKELKDLINEFEPDIIHSHLYCMKYLLPTLFKKNNMRLFHTIHNQPKKDAKGIDKFANKLAFKLFEVTPIALTEDYKEKVNKYYNLSTSIVVNNGIYLDKFKNLEIDMSNAKRRLGIDPETFVIGHIGRFYKQKNHFFIIDIFAEILKKNNNSCLVLVGDGELRIKIESKVKKMGLDSNVKFLGIREDIPEIIRSMDVFLFPSIYEGFPVTLIEAQATGIKCVISNTIDENAILSENTLSLDLEDSIERWSKVIIDSKIKNNFFRNIDEYDISKITQRLFEVYKINRNR